MACGFLLVGYQLSGYFLGPMMTTYCQTSRLARRSQAARFRTMAGVALLVAGAAFW